MMKIRRFGMIVAAVLAGSLMGGVAVMADDSSKTGSSVELKGVSGTAFGDGSFEASHRAMNSIENALRTAVDEGLDLSNPTVVENVISGMRLVDPRGPLCLKTISELTSEAKANLAKKGVADDDTVRKQLMEEAMAQYPLVPLKSKVDFFYVVGNKTRHVKGLFIAVNTRSMRVDDTHVTLLDLPYETRVKFDPKFNREVCEEYINSKLKQLKREAGKALQNEFDRLLQEQDSKNETNGYIYVRAEHLWATPKAYLRFVLPKYVKLSQEVLAKAAAERAEQEKRRAEEAASVPAGQGPQVDESVYRDILATQNKKRKEVSSFGGVDSEQGFGAAVWATPRKNVQIVFSRNSAMLQKNDRDVAKFSGTLPYSVDFFYNKGLLNRVVEYYATTGEKGKDRPVFKDERFIELMKRLHTLCGPCFEEKKLGIDNISDHILNDDSLPLPASFVPQDTSSLPSYICYKWFIDSDSCPKRCGADDTPNENLYVMHWVGKNNLIVVLFTFDDKADDAFVDFYIIREQLKK